MLAKPEFKKLLDKNYVVVHLDVMESGEKIKTHENAGGKDIMVALGGEKSGLPFFAFLDASGNKLANSNAMPKEQNIGCPATPEEILAFEVLLKMTAPKMAAKGREALLAHLTELNKPKPVPVPTPPAPP